MSDDTVLERLCALRAACIGRLDGLADADCVRQYHPALSPMSWHLGHTFFVEAYWLREVVFGDGTRTRPLHELFFPELNHKSERGDRLPDRDVLLAWCRETATENDNLWARVEGLYHPLLERGYLARFLAQHYAQHLETMAMVAQQRALADRTPADIAVSPLKVPDTTITTPIPVAGGTVDIGADPMGVNAYDNELQAHAQQIDDFCIARRPVSNAQWLAFMHDGGYHRDALCDVEAPDHWCRHAHGGWYAVTERGPEVLAPDDPVYGISHFEARAFARWAGARLPHEYEWEHAARNGHLQALGEVWEWCANPLHPYSGFRAFPYDGYSTPWFDGCHYVLRGGSRHTLAEIRRTTFRNFYTAGNRHIFAGLRLAWPD